jgi:hypothetical protein
MWNFLLLLCNDSEERYWTRCRRVYLISGQPSSYFTPYVVQCQYWRPFKYDENVKQSHQLDSETQQMHSINKLDTFFYIYCSYFLNYFVKYYKFQRLGRLWSIKLRFLWFRKIYRSKWHTWCWSLSLIGSRLIVQSNHYKYMVLIKVIAIDFFSVVKCVKSCSD